MVLLALVVVLVNVYTAVALDVMLLKQGDVWAVNTFEEAVTNRLVTF